MNQEKPMANGMFEGNHTLVIEGPDGGQQTFYRNTSRTMYLEVSRLRVCDNPSPAGGPADPLDLDSGMPGSPPRTALCVRGRATLGGGSVCLIGAPGNTAHILDIDFIASDEDVYKRQQQEARKRGMKEPYTRATLGFVHHQQSTAGRADWFVVCELPPNALRALSSALLSGAPHTMTVGLALPEVYSDDWERAPGQTNWFLRPNHQNNKTERPPRARGHVTHLDFDAVSPALYRVLEGRDELKNYSDTDAGMLSQ